MCDTFGDLLLATTSSDSHSIDDVSLFGAEAETSGLLWSCGTRTPMDNIELSVLPAAEAQQKPHDIRLFVAPNLLHVFIGTHFRGSIDLFII